MAREAREFRRPRPLSNQATFSYMKCASLIVAIVTAAGVGFLVTCAVALGVHWNSSYFAACTVLGGPTHNLLRYYLLVSTCLNAMNAVLIPCGRVFVRPYRHVTLGNSVLFCCRWVIPPALMVWGYLETIHWLCHTNIRTLVWTLSVTSATVNAFYFTCNVLIEMWHFGCCEATMARCVRAKRYVVESQRPGW